MSTDALETHFTPPHAPHPWQLAELGDGAAGRLLELLGSTAVTRDAGNIPGYVLTRFADAYGRAVALAYAGPRPGRCAKTGLANVAELCRCVNHRLLADGWVYPTFYTKLYVDFREELAAVTVAARDAATKRSWRGTREAVLARNARSDPGAERAKRSWRKTREAIPDRNTYCRQRSGCCGT